MSSEAIKNGEDTAAKLEANINFNAGRHPSFCAIRVTSYWIKTSRSEATEEISILLEGERFKHASMNDFTIRILLKPSNPVRKPVRRKDVGGTGIDRVEVKVAADQLPVVMEQLKSSNCYVIAEGLDTSGASSYIYSY